MSRTTDDVCLFCNIPRERVHIENALAYAIRDGFPVTNLHSLIIPRRHTTDYFGLTRDELLAIDDLLRQLREETLSSDTSVDGFNIGMNVGAMAGQTIFHCHVHLIPRRKGDIANPRGGVRHIIPGKGNYPG